MLVTVTGHDRPGITSALFAALAAHDVEVLDVEQVVISDRMVLGVVLALHGDPAPLRRAVTHAAEALGTEVEVSITEDPDAVGNAMPVRHHVMVLGRPLRAGAVGEMARRISDLGGSIHSIVRLTHRPVTALELVVSGVDAARLGAGLVQGAAAAGVDVAVERAGLQRRAKRLLMMDLETVLAGPEPFAALADQIGRGAESRRLLAAGEAEGSSTAEVVRTRAALLAGAPVATLDVLQGQMRWTHGSRALLGAARRAGHRTGVVTGGIAQVAERLVDGLELDFLAANRLETADGRLTGRIVGEVVGGGGRGRALVRFAESYGVPLAQSVAVGCGGEAAELLRLAGLGVVLDVARPAEPGSERSAHLDALLFVLGMRSDDPEEAPLRPEDVLATARRSR
ncbi:MAG TPA: ACT domain-containing protein [Mycobacteriales bacterium]|nr:ACT domain-containing protein [Mycobacteriales bacterium]